MTGEVAAALYIDMFHHLKRFKPYYSPVYCINTQNIIENAIDGPDITDGKSTWTSGSTHPDDSSPYNLQSFWQQFFIVFDKIVRQNTDYKLLFSET